MTALRKTEQVVEQAYNQAHWAELIEKVAQQADKKAFAALFEHFAPLVKSFAQSKYASDAEADELVQEVMLKVWNKAGAYNSAKAAVSTWIYTIARNTRIDMIRRQQKQANDIDADDVWLEDEDSDPFLDVQRKRSKSNIHESLESLPPEQKLVIQKAYMEGKTHQEVAKELDLPLGTVKGRLRLALKKLQIVLGETS